MTAAVSPFVTDAPALDALSGDFPGQLPSGYVAIKYGSFDGLFSWPRIDVGGVGVLFGGLGALTSAGNVRLLPASRQAGSRFGSGLRN